MMDVLFPHLDSVLAIYGFEDARVERVSMGNINHTFEVQSAGQRYILQVLNPIFGPALHRDIEVVTRHLLTRGMLTPLLVRTRDNELWTTDVDGAVWRVFTHIEGRIHSVRATPSLCKNAGALLGKFHVALSDLKHRFSSLRPGVHDTACHAQNLREVLETHRNHEAHAWVLPCAQGILSSLDALSSLHQLPSRIVHGDPKLNNIVFSPEGEALCMIDLDTIGPMSVPVELGDAFRSWCNPSGEDGRDPSFDLACFEAGMLGYFSADEAFLEDEEVTAIPLAVETITLELAARFCADALSESYFAWNRERFASASEHNLHRAQVQLSLAKSVQQKRSHMEAFVAALSGKSTKS